MIFKYVVRIRIIFGFFLDESWGSFILRGVMISLEYYLFGNIKIVSILIFCFFIVFRIEVILK